MKLVGNSENGFNIVAENVAQRRFVSSQLSFKYLENVGPHGVLCIRPNTPSSKEKQNSTGNKQIPCLNCKRIGLSCWPCLPFVSEEGCTIK
jgi:hypothetical protein